MSVGSRSGWVRLRSGLNNRTFGGNLKENKELNAHTDTRTCIHQMAER